MAPANIRREKQKDSIHNSPKDLDDHTKLTAEVVYLAQVDSDCMAVSRHWVGMKQVDEPYEPTVDHWDVEPVGRTQGIPRGNPRCRIILKKAYEGLCDAVGLCSHGPTEGDLGRLEQVRDDEMVHGVVRLVVPLSARRAET